ncbi:MAG: A/G-specific adenine glycosylase [Verrucomicrobia bacterium]|nr:MAG: A/G-specific adenine glycosylase [Verrucomicrobiota bacterium]TAE88398.1 MAG: A/G-specific adenine glycosylase [Verrucomicrobiota bacterium]TAF26852.1 MAG: A/G-specific adenine glycosylase [Verrucomicrobiota bacterium]TAF42110.1 MAG: A/G-specific adenine glycosylase [Verrucomicrobiota bacterium]
MRKAEICIPPDPTHPPSVLKPSATRSPLDASAEFRAAIRTWFEKEGRDYPWRRTREPYAVLVSEVMLQQTQIATVLGRGFYTRFLERFPEVTSLAAADDDSLLKAWEGLGYYRRARMLRETARAVIARHDGRFPTEPDALLALPGIGPYTAGALLSFAFEIPAPLVDGNVARVLSRLLDHSAPIDAGPTLKWLWDIAGQLLDPDHPRAYNSALMELGQTHCRPGVPDCLACPVAHFCQTRDPARLPVKAKRATIEAIDEHVIHSLHEGQILLSRQGKGRREGMWRLPVRDPALLADLPLLHRRKYGITRYRVTLHVHSCPPDHPAAQAGPDDAWVDLDEIATRVMPPADRAALAALDPDAEEIA